MHNEKIITFTHLPLHTRILEKEKLLLLNGKKTSYVGQVITSQISDEF